MPLEPALLFSADTTRESRQSGDIQKDSPGLSPVLISLPGA